MQESNCKGRKCETRKSDAGLDSDDGIACADDGDELAYEAVGVAVDCCVVLVAPPVYSNLAINLLENN